MPASSVRPKIFVVDIRGSEGKNRDFVVKKMINTIQFQIYDRISADQLRNVMRQCDVVVLPDK